jgi:hypothetical protein
MSMSTGEGGRGRGSTGTSAGGSEGAQVMVGAVSAKLAKTTEREREGVRAGASEPWRASESN